MKSYTDVNQSKKLAEILPLASADMKWFIPADNEGEFIEEVSLVKNKSEYNLFDKVTYWDDTPYVPCWSLAALLDILPLEVSINKQTDGVDTYYYIASCDARYCDIHSHRHINAIDACVEMIVKLNELKML